MKFPKGTNFGTLAVPIRGQQIRTKKGSFLSFFLRDLRSLIYFFSILTINTLQHLDVTNCINPISTIFSTITIIP